MSEKYKETDRMGDIICDDYRILQVISRFGLTLGFGDHTVSETCLAAGVDAPTFLAVVNFIRSNGRTSNLSDIVESLSLTALMNYLRRSHDYFVKFRLPAIRRKLIEAIDCSARNQIAFLILKFYDEFASEVGRHMDYEDKHIHTYVSDLMKGVKTSPDVNIHKLSHQHHDNHAWFVNILTEHKQNQGHQYIDKQEKKLKDKKISVSLLVKTAHHIVNGNIAFDGHVVCNGSDYAEARIILKVPVEIAYLIIGASPDGRIKT